MTTISDSSGARCDLRENAGVDFWRRAAFKDLTDLVGYTIFVRLEPRGAETIDIVTDPNDFGTVTVVGNVVEFSFSADLVPTGTPWSLRWVTPTGLEDILVYGQLIVLS